ncbi:MAG: LamB/YcsF family protein [Saprospiraceae bacterium]|nr:LamB/YcsF family protein [Saprospiraceae bacterium]
MTFDINCDMGESYGNYTIGNDDEIMPLVTSCNVACGFHGGDPLHIEKTLISAKKYQLKIGAHPGYPDLNGFGRRAMQLSEDELRTCIKYQVSALIGMAKSVGVEVSYVKPHGALYNKMADDEITSRIVICAILELDTNLGIMGLSASKTQSVAEELGVNFIAEAFADRRYDNHGRLVSRQDPRSIIHDPVQAAAQVFSIIRKNEVKSIEGNKVKLRAESICIHGDHKNAVAILKEIRKEMG